MEVYNVVADGIDQVYGFSVHFLIERSISHTFFFESVAKQKKSTENRSVCWFDFY